MGIFSILPESLNTVETWIIRSFFFLALITFGPWLLLLAYDLALYTWRSATYELPYLGGRARGRQRPRKPSLTERPSGHKRKFSLAGIPAANAVSEAAGRNSGAKIGHNGSGRKDAFERGDEGG